MENQNISWKVRDDINLEFDEKEQNKRYYVAFLNVASSDIEDLEKSAARIVDWMQETCDKQPYKQRQILRKILAAAFDLREVFVKICEIKGSINQLKEQIEKHGLE
jgi:hypothetical protein